MEDIEISTLKQNESLSFNKVKTKKLYKGKKYKNNSKLCHLKYIFIFFIFSIIALLIILLIIIYNTKTKTETKPIIIEKNCEKRKYDINFNYEEYDSEIITDKIKRDSGVQISIEEGKFINGIIRKNKLKNCLEIGVARGGSSIIILNAIKDMENSLLVSLDLNREFYQDPSKLTGYRVKEYFPELAKNWKLFTGDQPHKFLVELNIKFDFLFMDTAHVSPGEIFNFIEALPFLNENAIVVMDDLLWHFSTIKTTKLFPSCIALIPALYGDKLLMKKSVSKMGAVFLYPNQEEHYLDYFLLLLNFWEYIPKENHLNDLRSFIEKYYKDKIYIDIFDTAVKENKKANKKFENYIVDSEKKYHLVSLGTKWQNITD